MILVCANCTFRWSTLLEGENAPYHSRLHGDDATVDRCNGTGEPGSCAVCYGEGSLFEDRADSHGEHITVELPCHVCVDPDS